MKVLALGLAFSLMIGQTAAQTGSESGGVPPANVVPGTALQDNGPGQMPTDIQETPPENAPLAPGDAAGVKQAQTLSDQAVLLVPAVVIAIGIGCVIAGCLGGGHGTSSTAAVSTGK